VLDKQKYVIIKNMAEEKKETLSKSILEAYKGDEKEAKYALERIQEINDDLELREQPSLVTNGIPYSQAYEYNQRKAINYAPPKNPKDDRQVSMGIVHEKIISFASIFLKYVWKRNIKCYNDKGEFIKGMGEIYDLGIEFSHKLEEFKKKIALIYWETFTQGNAFVFEDWEVQIKDNPKAYNKVKNEKAKLVTADTMDYTYEFLDNLTYKAGEQTQTRRAVSIVLDGRRVIFGNPEVELIQEQPRITIEEEISAKDAEAIYGTLKRWNQVPKQKDDIKTMSGGVKTLFDASRIKTPDKTFIVHKTLDKENNKFNIFLNGLMMLPSETPMSLFYPRMNYPISNVPAERLRGSIYSRSTPAKTKFNADFIDWALKMLALKFAQGVNPAILSHGKYTLTRDMFRDGQVTHGVKKEDFDFANPDNKGVTNADFSFVGMLKEIIEAQSLNQTTAGELSEGNTAFEIAKVDQAQQDKLGYLLDGLLMGFTDMFMRRAETIESKYTIKQKETIVDGKKINVYQNFTVNVAGTENVIIFDDEVGGETYDTEAKRNELFKKSFNTKKGKSPTEYHLVNPTALREGRYVLDMDIEPERLKESQLQMIQLFSEYGQLIELFGRDSEGGSVSMDALKKEYLKTTGRPDDLFTSEVYKQLEQADPNSVANMGNFGKPTVKNAQLQDKGVVK
jgi:hypothetical protein